jgi:hypothetical protein
MVKKDAGKAAASETKPPEVEVTAEWNVLIR